MQKIIKQRNPSKQLFETLNFTCMNFFDSLVKKKYFLGLFSFSETLPSCVSAQIKCPIWAVQIFLKKKKCPKNVCFD